MDPKKRRKHKATRMLFCHTIIMTKNIRHVVTNITVITARPGAHKKVRVKMRNSIHSYKTAFWVGHIFHKNEERI